MGGCRCSFRECPNTTKTENLHFFHYPVKQKERCRIWIENARKPQFCNLEEEQLRNKVICDQHFEDKWFPNHQRKRLLQGAVPTLAGKCEDSSATAKNQIGIAEIPSFISHDQDIQVLPANDDGTVFILDTDAMFTKSQKIESYIYQNGSMIPSTLMSSALTPVLGSVQKPSSSKLKESKDLKVDPGLSKQDVFKTNVQTEPSEVTVKKEITDYSEKGHDSEIFTTEKEEDNYEVLPKRKATEDKVLRNSIKEPKDDTSLDKTYLRKINEHSRDIASIKKLLKEKALSETKPNTSTILSVLKEQLPPSLLTIVTMNLNQELELTDDDVDFFTMIHRVSPEVYQLLVERFKWNLPCVDIVDSIE